MALNLFPGVKKNTPTSGWSRMGRAIAIIPVLGALLAVSACAPTAPEETIDELESLRIGSAPAGGMISVWFALEKGLFLKHGLDVQMEEFNTGGEITQAIAAGHLDAGIANLSNSVPLARAGGTKLKATAMTMTADPNGIYVAERFGILARTDSGVTPSVPKTIAGKTVGLQVGGTPELYFRNYLKAIGLKAEDVKIQNIPVSDLGVALEQGIVDVGVTWDPYILRHLNDLGDAIALVQEGGNFVSDLGVWAASDELIEKRPEVAAAMLRAIVEATLLLAKDPAAGAEVATKYISGLSVEEAKHMLAKGSFDPRVSVCTIEDFERAQRELIDGGKLEAAKAFKIDELFALPLLDSVVSDFAKDFKAKGPLPENVKKCTGY